MVGGQLTPALLAQFLDVMRARGVASAVIRTSEGEASVTFEPSVAPLPGEAPTPGAWKSPVRLDAPDQFDE